MLRRMLPAVCLFATFALVTSANAANASRRRAPAQTPNLQFFTGGPSYYPVFFSSTDSWLGGSGNWSNSGQWSSGLPGQSSDVVINTGNDNVTWDTSANINSLTLGGSSGSSMLNENVGNGYELNIAGALTVNQSGTLNFGGSNNLGDTIIASADSSNAGHINIYDASALQINSNFTNSGGIGMLGFYPFSLATLGVGGNLINMAGGNITDSGTLTGTVQVGRDLQNSGFISVANLTVFGALTNNTGGYVEVDNGGTAASINNAGAMGLYNYFEVSGDVTNSGTMTLLYGGEGAGGGSFGIGGTLNNTSTGIITVTGYPGESMQAQTVMNAGSIQLLGFGNLTAQSVTNSGVIATTNPAPNTINVAGRFTNNHGGTLQMLGTGGDTAHISNLVNLGTVIVGNTNTLTVPVGPVSSSNSLAGFLNAGSVLIQAGGTVSAYAKYTQTAGQTTIDGHLAGINNFAGGSVYGNGGTITGNTTSNASMNFGDMPMTVGSLTFAGNFTQGANGSMIFDIAGQDNYDRMNITGQAHLNGLMTIDLLHGYVPQIGNMFEIMTFAGLTGTFSNVVGLPINGQEHFTLQYNSNNLTLDVVSGQLDGLSSLKTGSSNNEPYIQTAEAALGSQFGSDGAGSPQTTPEPGSFILLGSGLAGLVAFGRRKLNVL